MVKETTKLTVTASDFDVNDETFSKILKVLKDKRITNNSMALDFHTEPTERDMFDWLYDGDMDPWDIRFDTILPSEDDRCAEIDSTWYFWYETGLD